VGCFFVGCHVDTKNDTISGPTKAEAMNAAILGMVNPLEIPSSATAKALSQNYERGLQLVKNGLLDDIKEFFTKGLSDAPVPDHIPASEIKKALGQISGNLYVVGKPEIGKDLDIILVQNEPHILTESQKAILSPLQKLTTEHTE
jgi:hypothetical protein